MYPVVVYSEGTVLPTTGTYYVVAENGIFLHKDTGIVSCLVRVWNIPFLEHLNLITNVRCNLPKLPSQHVWAIKELFRRVVEEYGSEANTQIYYNKATKEFDIQVPKQIVSYGGVSYNNIREDIEENPNSPFLLVGTIHSHCTFEAFHSGTDINDEEGFDGLHVTFGHNHLDEFSISACIVVNGKRQQVDPLSVLEGIVKSESGRYKCSPGHTVNNEQITKWMSNIKGVK